MHIGMIGGIGPAATEFYYRNLVATYKAFSTLLELTIVHADVNQLVENIASGSPVAQADIYLELAQRLRLAGAEVIVISSIAGHFCEPEFVKLSPLPILNILPALDAEFQARKLDRIGLLGNRVTMESKLFGGITSAEVIVPEGRSLDLVHEQYLAMAVSGVATDKQRQQLFGIARDLCHRQGAQAVLLAGTDLFLAFEGHDCGVDVIDGALVHIASIHQHSLEYFSATPTLVHP